MFKEFKVFDSGIWLPYDELKICYNERVEYLQTVKDFPNLGTGQ